MLKSFAHTKKNQFLLFSVLFFLTLSPMFAEMENTSWLFCNQALFSTWRRWRRGGWAGFLLEIFRDASLLSIWDKNAIKQERKGRILYSKKKICKAARFFSLPWRWWSCLLFADLAVAKKAWTIQESARITGQFHLIYLLDKRNTKKPKTKPANFFSNTWI